MIVYLQKQYADDDQHESHWLRNGLLTAGALTAGHFAAKGGLMGRHMQKFAGNNQAWLGNKLGLYDFARSGQKASENAVAKINAGVTGRGGVEAFKAAGKSTADYRNAIKQARRSGDVTMVDKNLLQQERVKTAMDNVSAGNTQAAEVLGKQGFNKDMSYEQFSDKFNKTGNYKTITGNPATNTAPAAAPANNAANTASSYGNKMSPEEIAKKKAESKSRMAMNRKITADRQASAQAAADAGKISKIENGVANKQHVGVEGRTQEEITEMNKKHVEEAMKQQAANKEQSLVQQNNLKNQLLAKRAAAQEAAKNGWVETTGKEFMGPTLPNFG